MNISPSQDFPMIPCNIDANGAQIHIPIAPGITITVALSAENLVQMTKKIIEEQKGKTVSMPTIQQIRRKM